MNIWFKDYTLENINAMSKNSMMEHLDIKITEIGDSYIKATMPVDSRTVQTHGLLHGGASVVLAESLGSIAGSLVLNMKEQFCVGLDINANHIRSVKNGLVTGITKPIHIGRSTQVWEIKIYDEGNMLVCISRLTLAVIKK